MSIVREVAGFLFTLALIAFLCGVVLGFYLGIRAGIGAGEATATGSDLLWSVALVHT
ncbi:hypothetical protein ND486_00495 [Pseudonocardia sp. DR1-2]|uniref:hypothetical protein n=1 Tax=Pseudonocardia sp. DR1-2 TaxID=2951168 RepID=UPI002044CDA5|nr:hypothetical protein [Pseudonocardia sp. DR1-2]MCM3844671.1 hypothetical protein [Pseudonocardia sp. DR1-2]